MKYDVVFVDVDTQYDFMSPDGGLYVQGAEEITDNMAALVSLAGRETIPVIATMDTHDTDDPEFGTFPPHCVRGTSGRDKIPETRPERFAWVTMDRQEVPADPAVTLLVEKPTYDVFTNPNMPAVLEAFTANEYVVFGVATHFCVKAAVFGLIERGCSVTLVHDAVRPIAPDEDGVLEMMRNAGVRFVTTQEICARYAD